MVFLRRSCLWAGEWLGVNASHPAAQAYYDSRVELAATPAAGGGGQGGAGGGARGGDGGGGEQAWGDGRLD